MKYFKLLLIWLLLSLFPQAHSTQLIFFHNDAAGTPIMATNMSGAVVWSAQYAPYGERVSIKSSSGVETSSISSAALENNARWYVGKGYDEDTGLIYMGARYYDPRIGRFYGIDPKEVDEADVHSFNRYAYANNNPYRYVDPDGRNPLLVGVAGAMGVSALISGGGDALAQYIHKGNVDWKQVGRAALEGATEWPLVLVGGAGTSGRTAAANAERAAAMEARVAAQSIPKNLPKNPNNLLKQGYKETSHPNAAKNGHRTFENSKTGDTLRFDKGRPGEAGFEGVDHYHRNNPNSRGKQDMYLDVNGNPCSKGCDRSHILPRD